MSHLTPPAESLTMTDLGKPATVWGLELQSRFAMAPMTRRFSPDGIPGQDVCDYYTRRAAAGVGLILTEGILLDHPSAGRAKGVPRFGLPDTVSSWSRITDSVHEAGGKMIAQLWHLGAENLRGRDIPEGQDVLSPSGLATDGSSHGRYVTADDRAALIDSYVRAAGEAMRAGFDGVEIHAAHGYLLDEYLWSVTNLRSDGDGGDLAGRSRFVCDVVAAVRAETGSGPVASVRFSQWKTGFYDARIVDNPAELGQLTTALVEAGATALHPSTRRIATPAFEGSEITLPGLTRQLSGVPVIAVGSVGLDQQFMPGAREAEAGAAGLETLAGLLDPVQFDVVAIGRALLTNPDWVTLFREDRLNEARPYSKSDEQTLY